MEIPEWARFFLNLGYKWRTRDRFGRVISILSMPCDSAAAGLTTLGAITSDLERAESNDVDGHYDGLLRYAKQYLSYCKQCHLKKCEPDKKGCGYTAKASGKIRNKKKVQARKVFLVSEETDIISRNLIVDVPGKGGGTWQLMPDYALDWYIDGESPVVLPDDSNPISIDIYSKIVDSQEFAVDNLSASFSGLCLAGRTAGETISKQILSSIRFRTASQEASLDQLLTLSHWSSNPSVSRLVFYNSRTGNFDRSPTSIRLVVADGESAFLRVLDEAKFQYSDVIGIYRRTTDRDALEKITDRLLSLRQWYSEIPAENLVPGPIPLGINAKVLIREK